MNHVEQIKSIISPSALISRYLNLTKKGEGEFVALCPFHQENTPSLTVSDRKGFYYCFGCGARGDIFSFLMQKDGKTYRQSLEQLASESGISLPKYYLEKQQSSQHATLQLVYHIAAQFFHQQLYAKYGGLALDYLTKRGIADSTIAEFNLGYLPHSQQSLLWKRLLETASEETILSSKIFSMGQSGPYCLFSNRLIFPIADRKGRVIAFGGRALEAKTNQPKYINSNEHPLFIKGHALYNLHQAANAAKSIIVVEGYMDVLSMHNVGIKHVVASMTSNLKLEQLRMLWSIVDEVIICLDSDQAGKLAAERLAKMVLPELSAGKSLSFCNLQGAKDPDEMIQKYGAAAIHRSLDSSTPLSETLFMQTVRGISADTPEGKLKLQNSLGDLTRSIKNPQLAKNYQQFFRERMFQHFRTKSNHRKPKIDFTQDVLSVLKAEEPEVFNILSSFVIFPELIEEQQMQNVLMNLEIKSKKLSDIRDFLLDDWQKNRTIRPTDFLAAKLAAQYGVTFDQKGLDLKLLNSDYTRDDLIAYVNDVLRKYNVRSIHKQIQDLQSMLKSFPNEQLFGKLVYLKKQEELLNI